ncbi:MAG: nitrate reductase cytochrome c-type subunit [Gammaproteobacteria bacterium]|nr:nitrate reductase cytochrome c-type subunit [Gammaproteobacteria bacterium]MBU1722535.1 nitrate reductase cytochrome c-type subunit [Gammaproteobacteria bacterium]MBU2004436.1 nitrate reductase cytochrome c-type subunit [Gammaproteobacteria bacterium]
MSAALFADDAAKDAKPAEAATAPAAETTTPAVDAPAAESAPAEQTAATDATATDAAAPAAAASDVNASAAPKEVFAFDGQVIEIGGAAPDADSAIPDNKRWSDSEVVDRNYFQQPPMIPHKVEEYRITANNNKCMSCHSWDNYKKNNATKISQTHFKDRDGKDHSSLAARRYFCNQCHVPQVDAPPLVENEFKPVKELNK